MGVESALAPEQVLVRADFHDFTPLKADDPGAGANRSQAMSDDDDGAAAHDRAHVLLDDPLAVIVERRRRLVDASDGGIFTYGNAAFHGSMGGQHLNQPVVGMASTPDGGGYWEVAADGGHLQLRRRATSTVRAGSIHLNKPVVGMAATPDGGGYWLVASDGGIFNYGDAGFYGSTGAIHLNKPVVGMAATPDGHGYWLVASDGGIFSYGDARFYGSTGGIHLNKPVVGMARARRAWATGWSPPTAASSATATPASTARRAHSC